MNPETPAYRWKRDPSFDYMPSPEAPVSQEETEAITLPQPVPQPTEYKPEPAQEGEDKGL